MNDMWNSGNAKAAMPIDATSLAYDDHRYLKWATKINVTHASYLATSCNDNRSSKGETPTIVGEFSLSVPDVRFSTSPPEIPKDNWKGKRD